MNPPLTNLAIPYLGLRPFFEEDHLLFFGRHEQANELLMRLEDSAFVAVVGSSGSGKSSLVRAGLLPLLRDGFLFGTDDWKIAVARPGHEPYQQLASKLAAFREDVSQNDVLTWLRRSDDGLLEAFDQLCGNEETHVLVVIDQFEELFGFRRAGDSARSLQNCASRDEAAAFVAMLLVAARKAGQRLRVMLTMRSDFVGHCEVFLGLPQAVSQSQFLVPRLTRSQMEAAITGPSRIRQAEFQPFDFQPGLVNTLINEAGDRPDQLPLLQHALMRTWKESDRKVLTEANYTWAGRIEKSLSNDADDAFNQLDADGQRLAQHLFLLLCDVSPEGQITRRRPLAQEVMDVARVDCSQIERVMRGFQAEDRNFLLPPRSERIVPSTVLDVTHEILLRQWTKLGDWMEIEKKAVDDLRQFVGKAQRWHDTGEIGYLQPPELHEMQEWKRKSVPSAVWAERYVTAQQFQLAERYLEASTEEEQRQKNEAEKAKAVEATKRKGTKRKGTAEGASSKRICNHISGNRVVMRLFVLAHPQSESAGLLAQELMRRFVDPLAIGGLRIPVFLTPDQDDGRPPAWEGPDGIQLDKSRHTLVVVLADARMALRTSLKSDENATGAAWQQFLEEGAHRAPAGSSPHHVFAVAIAKPRNERESADAGVVALGQARHVLLVPKEPIPRQKGESDEVHARLFDAWLTAAADDIAMHISIRAIRLLADETAPPDRSIKKNPSVRLFLSHSKADLMSDEFNVVQHVKEALKELPIESWFENAKIRPGETFESTIAAGLQDCTTLIAFMTDTYASRSWCQQEIMEAKRLGTPILVVDALRRGEVRNFPYLGNVPTVCWRGDDAQAEARRIVGRAVRESLRFMHGRAVLERWQEDGEMVLASAPEALVLAWHTSSRGTTQFLYPDPPLTKTELDVLYSLRPNSVFRTPMSKLTNWKKPAGLNCIAVSASVSMDKHRFGLTKQHEESLFDELHGYLLLAGLQIGYGGSVSANFRSATNFTLRLFELVRSYSALATTAETKWLLPIVNFAAWPLRLSYGQSEAELFSNSRTAEVRCGAEPPKSEIPKLDEQGQPLFPDGINIFSLPDTPLRRLAWTRGLTLMRQQMTRETQARLVIGGTLSGFRGLYPGVVEEAWLSIMTNLGHSPPHPLYLVGAFGGAARAVIDLLEGRDRPDLRQTELGERAPSIDSILELAKSRGLTVVTSESSVDPASLNMTGSLVTPDRIATDIDSVGRRGLSTALCNGLTDAENQELFRTPDASRIAELILNGLSRV